MILFLSFLMALSYSATRDGLVFLEDLGLFYAIGLIVSISILFSKAGLSWWKALIPIYNFYCMWQIIFNNARKTISVVFSCILGIPIVLTLLPILTDSAPTTINASSLYYLIIYGIFEFIILANMLVFFFVRFNISGYMLFGLLTVPSLIIPILLRDKECKITQYEEGYFGFFNWIIFPILVLFCLYVKLISIGWVMSFFN